jgi:hypothetical protein
MRRPSGEVAKLRTADMTGQHGSLSGAHGHRRRSHRKAGVRMAFSRRHCSSSSGFEVCQVGQHYGQIVP